jgi:RNA polymerase sigma factor (sigma-70 family)
VPVARHPTATSPEEGVLLSERLATLERCLGDLGEREREVLGLRFVAGLRNGEIAAVIGTSEGNVAKIVHRTLRALRGRLTAEGDRDDRSI